MFLTLGRVEPYELHERHRRCIALTDAGLQHPRIAALASDEVRSDLAEQPCECVARGDRLAGHALGVDELCLLRGRYLLAFGDERLNRYAPPDRLVGVFTQLF